MENTDNADNTSNAAGGPQGLHRRAWDFIPWVVNGSATETERHCVEEHVAICPDCRDELARQSLLRAGMAAGAVPLHDPGPSLQRLWSRIDRLEGEGDAGNAADTPRPFAPADRKVAGGWTRWLAAAVVAQAIGLAALVGVVWERPRAGDYVTLSRAPAMSAGASVRLVPAPALRLADLQSLLLLSGMQIVESNGDATILGLAARPGHAMPLADSLARLRASPAVLLAEPIGSASSAGR